MFGLLALAHIMFKIVTTVEDGVIRVLSVPTKWINGFNLKWPPASTKPRKISRWREKQQPPDEDWLSIPCKVRPTAPIYTYADGMEMEKMYSNFIDTDAEIA